MSIEDIGTVTASGGRYRKVEWDNKTGEVIVEQIVGSSRHITGIGIYTNNRAEAVVIAQQWLDANTDK